MKDSHCTRCKGNRLTPTYLEPKETKEVPIQGKWSSSTVVSCPHKNVRVVHNQPARRTGVC